MCWQAEIETGEGIRKIRIRKNEQWLSYEAVINGWLSNDNFIAFFSGLLEASPFAAFYWETPPINQNTVDRKFEFVEIESHLLGQMPVNKKPFESYFNSVDEEQVVAFDNLGGDAKLIVPCPGRHNREFPHIAAFVRAAPDDQVTALWKRVGNEAKNALNTNNMWISTAGTGVSWLHVRLDSYPKYYSYNEYRND